MLLTNQSSLERLSAYSIGLQSGKCFCALDKVIGRTSIWFLRKYAVEARKTVCADFLDFAAVDIVEVVRCRRMFQTAAKNTGKQKLRKQLTSDRKKGDSSQQNLPNKPIGFVQKSCGTFLVDNFQQLWVPTICDCFWNFWTELPT